MAEAVTSYSDSTALSGAANAAELEMELSNGDFDIHYDFAASGDVVIQVSQDGVDWWGYRTISETASAEDIIQDNTMFDYVRTYADNIADGDVNDLTVVTKI